MFSLINFHFGKVTKEYLLFFFFILLVANPFLMQSLETGVVLIFLLTFFYFRNKLIPQKKDILPLVIIAYFVLFEIIHRVIFDLDNTKTIIRVSFYFFTALILVKITHNKFIEYYVRVIYFLSIISLIFYAIGYMAPSMYAEMNHIAAKIFPLRLNYVNYSTPTFLFYTFDQAFVYGKNSLLRNPGYTWEAGGFATYANVAILLRLIATNTKNLTQLIKDRTSIVIVSAMLLTFSTAGYITFAFVLLVYFLRKLSLANIFYLSTFLFVFILLFNQLDFLGDKVTEQISTAGHSQNRFGSALLDWNDIQKRPIFGWSRNTEVLFKSKGYSNLTHRPNGVTNFIRSYGFIYFISFFTFLFYSMKIYLRRYTYNSLFLTFALISIILLMGFTQQVVHTMFTMYLLFLGYYKQVKQ